jgi:PAS domain S-box-containing protein
VDKPYLSWQQYLEDPTYEDRKKGFEELKRHSMEPKSLEKELNVIYAALSSAANAVLITDREGSIQYANPAFIRMFGYESEKEVTGKCAAQLFAFQKGRRFADVEAIIDQSKGVTEQFQLLRKEGGVFHVEVSTSGITDNEGRQVGRMAWFVDITDRKRIEEALHQSSEKLKLFAYSVSHDLKSPTIGLYGLTKRLYKDYAGALDEKGQKYCEQILMTAEQIAALVEQINVFISTKEMPLAIERLSLKEVLQVIRDEFSTRLNIREIRWCEPDVIPEIEADRLSIIRALRNLVDNALKYGGEGLSEINIRYSGSGGSHILSVEDNGIGLKEQNSHQDIFAPFIRKNTSKGIQGSGLRLTIVREIAEKHGGKVWIEPSQEKGITFYMSIPRNIQGSP